MTKHAPSTIVVGLGNPILSDDAVGWRVVDLVRQQLGAGQTLAVITEACVGGLSLAELLGGYSRAIIVDATLTHDVVPGTVVQFCLVDLPGTLNMASAHDTNLSTALHTLRRYGATLPANDAIDIVAIEAEDVWTFAEQCTPQVEKSIPEAAKRVLTLLGAC